MENRNKRYLSICLMVLLAVRYGYTADEVKMDINEATLKANYPDFKEIRQILNFGFKPLREELVLYIVYKTTDDSFKFAFLKPNGQVIEPFNPDDPNAVPVVPKVVSLDQDCDTFMEGGRLFTNFYCLICILKDQNKAVFYRLDGTKFEENFQGVSTDEIHFIGQNHVDPIDGGSLIYLRGGKIYKLSYKPSGLKSHVQVQFDGSTTSIDVANIVSITVAIVLRNLIFSIHGDTSEVYGLNYLGSSQPGYNPAFSDKLLTISVKDQDGSDASCRSVGNIYYYETENNGFLCLKPDNNFIYVKMDIEAPSGYDIANFEQKFERPNQIAEHASFSYINFFDDFIAFGGYANTVKTVLITGEVKLTNGEVSPGFFILRSELIERDPMKIVGFKKVDLGRVDLAIEKKEKTYLFSYNLEFDTIQLDINEFSGLNNCKEKDPLSDSLSGECATFRDGYNTDGSKICGWNQLYVAGSCKACADVIPGCTSCDYDMNICVSCGTGFDGDTFFRKKGPLCEKTCPGPNEQFIGNQCRSCYDPNCDECDYTSRNCLTCKSGLTNIRITNNEDRCWEATPSGNVFLNPDSANYEVFQSGFDQSRFWATCDSYNCQTCRSYGIYCQQCKPGYNPASPQTLTLLCERDCLGAEVKLRGTCKLCEDHHCDSCTVGSDDCTCSGSKGYKQNDVDANYPPCIPKCDINHRFIEENDTCRSCLEDHCTSCEHFGRECTQCEEGYKVDSTTNLQPQDPLCIEICPENFRFRLDLDGMDECIDCLDEDKCQLCDYTGESCQTCIEGFIPNTDANGLFIQGEPLCKDNRCKTTPNQYFDEQKSKCVDCESENKCSLCKYPSGECQTCVGNHFLKDGNTEPRVCFPCPDFIENCVNCNTKEQCSLCSEGFTVNGSGVCSPCSDFMENCVSCGATDQCNECSEGFFVNENRKGEEPHCLPYELNLSSARFEESDQQCYFKFSSELGDIKEDKFVFVLEDQLANERKSKVNIKSFKISEIKITDDDKESLELKLEIYTNVQDATLTATFLEDETIKDHTGYSSYKELSLSVDKIKYSFSKMAETFKNATPTVGVVTAVVTGLALASSQNSGYKAIQFLQLFELLLFIDIEIPINFLNFIGMINGNIFEFIPNFWNIEEPEDEYSPHQILIVQDLNALILNNVGNLILEMVILFAIKLLVKFLKGQHRYINKANGYMNTALITNFCLGIQVDILIAVVINLRNLKMKKFIGIFNGIISLFFVMFYLLLNSLYTRKSYELFQEISKKKNKIESKEPEEVKDVEQPPEKSKEAQEAKEPSKEDSEDKLMIKPELKKWLFLKEELKEDIGLTKFLHPSFLSIRDYALTFVIVSLIEFTTPQVMITTITYITSLVLSLRNIPYLERKVNVVNISSDIYFSVVYTCFAILHFSGEKISPQTRINIVGNFMIGVTCLMITTIIFNCVVDLSSTFIDLKKMVSKTAKIHPVEADKNKESLNSDPISPNEISHILNDDSDPSTDKMELGNRMNESQIGLISSNANRSRGKNKEKKSGKKKESKVGSVERGENKVIQIQEDDEEMSEEERKRREAIRSMKYGGLSKEEFERRKRRRKRKRQHKSRLKSFHLSGQGD